MGHLTNEEFFTKLGEVFASRKGKDHGAVYLVQKRLTFDQDGATPTADNHPLADLNPAMPLPILIRATNGKGKDKKKEKLKLSTTVEPDMLDTFYARYAELCKAGMTALKPRDRSKKKAKAKRRRGGGASGATAGGP